MEDAFVEHGRPLPIAEGVGTTTNGLTPALPISTEPNGIPVRAAPPGEVGDVAADDEASDEALLLELVPHVPEVAAPPGNVPVPAPSPPPSKFVLEPDIPNDGLPMSRHVVPFPVTIVPSPVAPMGIPLSPGDVSSVAPMGIPVGGTGEPAAMPSGEVAPIPGVGLPIPPPCPPTCANAGMQPKSAACIAAINTRRITISIVRTIQPARQ
jgi:hypothetical protein